MHLFNLIVIKGCIVVIIKGEKVRALKGAKAEKAVVDAAVKELLALKAKYKQVTGVDLAPPAQPRQEKKKKGGEQQQQQQQQKKKSPAPAAATVGLKKPETTNADLKKITRLGIEVRKEDDLSEWLEAPQICFLVCSFIHSFVY